MAGPYPGAATTAIRRQDVILARPIFTGIHICGCLRAGNPFLQTDIAGCRRPVRGIAAFETI
jgi:hypothetical protein